MVSEQILEFNFESSEYKRLDHFLVEEIPDHSRTFLQRLIKKGNVKIDGEVVTKTGARLDKKVVVEIVIPPIAPSKIVAEKIPLDIIFENDDVIIINKPPGMVVHPSAGHSQGTLVNAVLGHVPEIEGVGGEQRPGLVHRLDKNTSGLIALAKNDATHQLLQAQFAERTVNKFYMAIIDGSPPTDEGKIKIPLWRDPKNRQKMGAAPARKGKEAISIYKVVESFDFHSLLQVQILTGRTHQIRVHLASIGCPIVGDSVYGRRHPSLQVNRQMLHAAKLGIRLPGQEEQQEFIAEIPEDMARILNLLRNSEKLDE